LTLTRFLTIALFFTAALVLANFPTAGNTAARAAGNEYLSIDLSTTGNGARSVGRIQSCTEVEPGQQFVADIAVRDVTDLVAWEMRIDYDSSLISIDSVDYDHFLLNGEAGITISPKLFESETPDRVFVGAGEVRGTPDSGSGILARLHITAGAADGISPFRIPSDPSYLGPRLSNAEGHYLGDSTGDGIWDAGITSGQIAVGVSCEQATPIPTPPPPVGGGPGSGGGDGGSPGGNSADGGSDGDGNGGGDSGDGGDGDDSAAGEDSVAVIDGEDATGGGEDASASDAETSGEDDGGSAVAGDEDGPDSGGGDDASDGDGDGSSDALPYVIGGLAAAAVIGGAAILIVFRGRRAGF
jgi:hypothetical protein